MTMLTDRDFARICEEVGKVIEDNILPQIEEMLEEKFEQKFEEKFEEKFAPIRATMVTKDYLDEKLAVLRGDLIANDRKLEERTTRHIEGAPKEELDALRIFPRPENLLPPR